MKKILLSLLFITTLTFSKNVDEYFNFTIGTSFNNPIVRLETVFDPHEIVELGFGVGYEGFHDSVYKVTLKDELLDPLFQDRDDALNILKNMLKTGIRGTSVNTMPGATLGIEILKVLYHNQPDVYFTFKKKFGTGFAAMILGWMVEDGSQTPTNANLQKSEIIKAIMNDPTTLEQINNLYINQRNDVTDEVTAKIDALTFDDLLGALPDFVAYELRKKGIADDYISDKQRDILKLDIYNIINYMEVLKGMSTEKALNFDVEAYKKAFEPLSDDKASLEEQSATFKDLMKIIIEKYIPEVKVVDIDLSKMFNLDVTGGVMAALSRLDDIALKSEDNDKQIFILNEALIGLSKDDIMTLKDKTLADIDAIKEAFANSMKQPTTWKKITSSLENFKTEMVDVTSHNVTGYVYIKEKFGKGPLKHYLRQEAGIMQHINNPLATLSATAGFGYGIELNNRYGFDARVHTIIPVISNYNSPSSLRDISIYLPNLFRFSVNFVIRL